MSSETSLWIAQAIPFSQITLSVAPAQTKHHHFMVETTGSTTSANFWRIRLACRGQENASASVGDKWCCAG